MAEEIRKTSTAASQAEDREPVSLGKCERLQSRIMLSKISRVNYLQPWGETDYLTGPHQQLSQTSLRTYLQSSFAQ